MSAILEQLKAERNEIAKAIRVVLDDGTAPDNLVEHVRFLMLEEYDPIVKRSDELKRGIAALRERVKVLEETGNKLVSLALAFNEDDPWIFERYGGVEIVPNAQAALRGEA